MIPGNIYDIYGTRKEDINKLRDYTKNSIRQVKPDDLKNRKIQFMTLYFYISLVILVFEIYIANSLTQFILGLASSIVIIHWMLGFVSFINNRWVDKNYKILIDSILTLLLFSLLIFISNIIYWFATLTSISLFAIVRYNLINPANIKQKNYIITKTIVHSAILISSAMAVIILHFYSNKWIELFFASSALIVHIPLLYWLVFIRRTY